MNNATTVAIVGLVIVAGGALWYLSQQRATSAADAVAAYERGRSQGAKRTTGEAIGGAVATLGSAVTSLVD
jgi:hypothetical protein